MVANVGGRTDTRNVDAGSGQVGGSRVTGIVSTQVVVIAELDINRGEDTSNGGVTRIVSASVTIVARRDRSILALGVGHISRVEALVGSAKILVITSGIGQTGSNGRAKIGEIDESGRRITDITSTSGIGRNRIDGDLTARNRVAISGVAEIRSSARHRSVYANSGRWNQGVGEITNLSCANIVIIAV